MSIKLPAIIIILDHIPFIKKNSNDYASILNLCFANWYQYMSYNYKSAVIITTVIFLNLISSMVQAQNSNPSHAIGLIQHVDELLRGKQNYAVYKMIVTTPRWERELQLEAWDDRQNHKTFIHVLAPVKDHGTKYLRIQYKLWAYLPKLERVLKIPPSMMLQSWMGSDFNNDDLVKESSIIEDYDHKLAGEENINDYLCYIVELLPKPNAPVVWGKILYWISSSELLPVKEQFFSEKGKLIKELIYSDFKTVQGRTIPTKYVMTNYLKTGHQTKLYISKIVFDKPFDNNLFSMQNLRKAQ